MDAGKIGRQLDLAEGREEEFLEQARARRRYGAAVIVMAFDEQGQADSLERKVKICSRAYEILVDEVGFDPTDIIFDPNVLTVATGIEEHNAYGVEFFEAVRRLSEKFPLASSRAASATSRSHSAATRPCARRCTPRFSTTPSKPA